jgi:hypothetical protein
LNRPPAGRRVLLVLPASAGQLSSRPLGAQGESGILISSAPTSPTWTSLRPFLYVAVPYLVMFVLMSLPCYNWLYYWAITLVWLIVLLASLVIIPSLVATSPSSLGCLCKVALSAFLLIALLAIRPLSNGLKSTSTHILLESLYCHPTDPGREEVLGGLLQIEAGVFEDTSFCWGPNCRQDFITCRGSTFRDLR